MTEQEAIDILNSINKDFFQPDDPNEFDDVNKALEMAIKALEKPIAVKKTILDYSAMPRVKIDEKLYVDKEIFVGYVLRLLEEEMKDAQSEDETCGYEVSMQILCNV